MTGFHYSFDEETDEIIFKNFTEIPASYFFNCQVAYKFTPYNIKDGYANNNIEATFEVKMPDETETIKNSSEPLTVQVETVVPKPSASKNVETKYEKWQTEWGEKPSDSEDYFYVIWRLYTYIGSAGTQPYNITFEENPDAIGEIIGWYKGSSSSSNFIAGDKTALDQYVFYAERETSTSSSNISRYDYVVVKYPREAVAAQDHKVTNAYTAVVTGMDGDQKKDSSQASYTYTKVDFEYQGDILSVRKSNSSTRYGGINELESGLDTDTNSPFYLYVSNRGYGLTNEGTAPYTTYLEDKQLYIQNERLTPEDYSFTKFYLSSFDEYGYTIDDEKGYVRDLNKDYASYQPVEVYVRTENNQDWAKLGTIQKDSSSSYRWTGLDGSSTQHSYSYPVILPAGTWDISFRHTGTQYEVYYSVYLYTQLHPSEHILGLLKDQSSITCYNICSGYATDAQGIIRSGGTPPSVSTTIKNEVTQADMEEYGQIIAHDYIYAYFTRWSSSGSVDKSASSPVSDPIKGQESVRYTLQQYDYLYLNNSSQKQAVIDSGVIAEHRDGIFYDLLPAGTSVDVNSAYLHTTSTPTAGGAESTALEECSRVQVSVRDADVEIHKNSDPESGKENAPALVEVEGTIDYAIEVTNKETAETIQNVVIEDEIPAGLTSNTENIQCYFGDAASKAELVSASTRVSLNADGQKLTFTVDKLAGGETVHLLIPTCVHQTAAAGMVFENTAKITGFNNKKKTIESETTWHKTDPETVDITVNKMWEDRDDAYHTRPEDVEVQLYADGVAVDGKTAKLNAANNWSYQFTDLTKYQNDGATEIRYTIKETTILGDYDATYSADARTVTNTLKTSSGNVGTNLKVVKYRSGTMVPVAGAVFHLKDDQDEIVHTATTDAEGIATFVITPPSDADTYELTLVEASAPAGYTATTDTWRVKFTRGGTSTTTWNPEQKVLETIWTWTTEVFQGETSSAEYQDGALTVYNDYDASGQLQLTASKQLIGRALADGEFSFVVEDEKHQQVAKGTSNADGTISFLAIEYDMTDVGNHIYTISEVRGNLSHVTYDNTAFIIPVDVTDNGDGTLTATPHYPEGGITFRNTYSPPGSSRHIPASATVKISAQKTLDGIAPEGSQFTFVLRDASGKEIQSVTNNGGNITFEPLEYSTAGTYTYTLVEQIGLDSGIRYDASVYTVTVQVVKATNYKTTVSYKLNGQAYTGIPVFRNTTNDTEKRHIQVSVNKVWNDNGAGERPASVTVQLYKNGAAYGDSVELSATNDWCYTWDNLDETAT